VRSVRLGRRKPVQSQFEPRTSRVGPGEQRALRTLMYSRLRLLVGPRAHRVDSAAGDLTIAVEKRSDPLGLDTVDLGKLVNGARRCAAASPHRVAQFGRRLEQRQVMSHRHQAHAKPLGDHRVGLAGIGARADEACQVQRCEAMPLLVLGDLGLGIGQHVASNLRNLGEPATLRCTPTFCANVDAVATQVIGRVSDDGLPPDTCRSCRASRSGAGQPSFVAAGNDPKKSP
jgi:hypothetical protein